MNKYTSFYFLHVPKTGGRFLTKYIIDPVTKELSDNSIGILENPKINNVNIKNRHVGWHTRIDPSTYIVSCIREPVEWACSYFIHHMYYEMNALDMENEAVVVKNIDKEFTGTDVVNWIKNNPFLQNYQSKNFILGAGENSSIKHEIIKNEQMKYEINKEFLNRRLNRVNLLFRQSDFKNMDYNILLEKISNDLGIKIDYRLNGQEDKGYYSNDASKALYDSLSNLDKASIESLLPIDLEVYSDNSLFWSTK